MGRNLEKKREKLHIFFLRLVSFHDIVKYNFCAGICNKLSIEIVVVRHWVFHIAFWWKSQALEIKVKKTVFIAYICLESSAAYKL